MPRVPTTPLGTVAPAQVTGARFQGADNNGGAFGAMGEGFADIGEAVSKFADAQDKIDDMLDETVSRDKALEYQKRAAPLLTRYKSLTGLDAVHERVFLDEELAKLRDETLGSTAEGRQRRYTEARIEPLHLNATTQIGEHSTAQAVKYRDDTFEAQKINFAEQAATEWKSPELAQTYRDSGLAVIDDQARAQGLSPAVAQTMRMDWVSGVHKMTVGAMLGEEDYEAADEYLNTFGDEIDAADELSLRAELKPGLDYIQAGEDVTRAYGMITPGADGTASVGVDGATSTELASGSADWWERVEQITLKSESRGERYDSSGNLLTSSKGARGEMQVMPDTQRDPGYGVRPAQDDSPGEIARVGRDYLRALHKKYDGDPAKMWAAYNAGPSRVDGLISKHGDKWLSFAPKETRDYVSKNTKALGGNPKTPEKVSFKWQNPLGDAEVTSPYNEKRGDKNHVGTDLAKPEGTAIKPMGPGKIKSVNKNAGDAAGYYVVIDHGNGYTSSYSHMKDEPKWKVGDAVTAETVIGAVGMTGRTSGPHLHLVVRKDGVRIDPMSLVGQESSTSVGGPSQRQVTVPGVENKGQVYANIDKIAAEEGWSPQRVERAKQKADRDIARDQEVKRIAENEADKQADNIVLQLGDDFTDISQIPAEVRKGMSHGAIINYTRGAQSNLERKNTPKSDGDTFISLHSMSISDPEGFSKVNLAEYRDKMTPQEFSTLVSYRAQIGVSLDKQAEAEAEAQRNAADKAANDKAARAKGAQQIGPSTWSNINRYTAGDKTIDDKERRAIYDIAYPRLSAIYEKNGFLTDADYDEAMKWATRTVPVKMNNSFMGVSTGQSVENVRIFEMTPEHIPDATRKRIASGRRARGLPVDEESIYRDYIQNKGRPGYW